MDKDKNKGLADNQDGEFILNESGTSVSIDTLNNSFDEDADVKLDETENVSDGQKGKGVQQIKK
ncbi:hypothetical protein [Segetibacter sp.]|jgi:hypothetical protein|uniref:hypothetical protein n=1 Tax=Segetibacter sp. TaxID=2231182 RepID=UPI00262727A8|nr:hypothetical protein [Segetibacter sp.]MCW3079818.1 hypothetical protein [Segetibacter sp.]